LDPFVSYEENQGCEYGIWGTVFTTRFRRN
jgi:hypothetical protein